MESPKRLRLFLYAGAAYILIAFMWWTLLLFRKTDEAWRTQVALLQSEMSRNEVILDDNTFLQTPQYQAILQKHKKQNWMIWGEGSVLFIGLLVGVWIIHRSFFKEMELNNQQRNFLLSVTHELKTPIAAIQLILQTFQKRKLDETQQAKLLGTATAEADRLNELVSNLLMSSRLDSQFEMQFEEFSVTPLLTDMIEKYRIKFPKITFQYTQNDLPILRGDRQALMMVFTNLIENAIKYSDKNSEIKLTQSFDNQQFIFDISDNGIGVSGIEKKKIFQRFYRVGSEMTRATKGAGLGLFIVDQIVKLHKGAIQVLDNSPKGTIFRVNLPETIKN
jgi:signal transduction histidine kinase